MRIARGVPADVCIMINSNVWSLEGLLQHDSSIGASSALRNSWTPSESRGSKANYAITLRNTTPAIIYI